MKKYIVIFLLFFATICQAQTGDLIDSYSKQNLYNKYMYNPVLVNPMLSGGTAGSILFLGASKNITQDNTNLNWNDTSDLLTATSISGSTITYSSATFTSANIGGGTATFSSSTHTWVDINGGTIDGTTIGANSATTGVFTTVNTGQGAYELYKMNQNVDTTGQPTFKDLTVTYGISAATGTFSDDVTFNDDTTWLTGKKAIFGNSARNITDSGTTIVISTNTVVTGNIYTAAWADYYPSSTVVGWAATPSGNIYYKKIGNLVFVTYYITGTSNATNVTFTVPYTSNANMEYYVATWGQDNGVTLTGACRAVLPNNSITVTVIADMASAVWTNTGTKTVRGQFWYEAQ